MEYVFGTKGDAEIVKTKGKEHSCLSGFHEVRQEYPDQVITDQFHIARKINSSEDSDGNCYDWYELDKHYRTIDKTGPLNALIEQLTDLVGTVQIALCELDEIISGGEA